MSTKKPFKNCNQAYDYIAQSTNYEKKTDYIYSRDVFDLRKVREHLEDLGNPDQNMDIVHIAGTKGKGSVAFMIAAILLRAGYQVGRFISPHLVRINERITVDNTEITDSEFTQLLNILYPQMEKAKEDGTPLTFFDIITILALLYFSKQSVDFAVLETGLGGRLDSTNVVNPAVCAITSIGYDHIDKLGNTLAAIASEKAGIIKEKIPVVLGTGIPEAVGAIQKVARSKDAHLFQIGEDFKIISQSGNSTFTVKTWRQSYPHIFLPLLGTHQRANAAVAIAALDSLQDRDIVHLDAVQVKEALAKLIIPARIELISDAPTIILDVAHNPSSLLALAHVLQDVYPDKRKVFLFGMLEGKDIKGSLHNILPLANEIVFTAPESPRGEDPKKLAHVAREFGLANFYVEHDIKSAYKLAFDITGQNGLLCITGSTYLAGKIKSLIGNEGTYWNSVQ